MKKLVNVYADKPFKMNSAMFCGLHRELVLDVKQIQACIEHKARVEEVLKNGRIVPLGFDNFDQYNGESSVDDSTPDSLTDRIKEPKVEIVRKRTKQTTSTVQKNQNNQSYNLKNKTSVATESTHTVTANNQKQQNNVSTVNNKSKK